ncbi:hypothetical protein [Streptomyces sp. NPDC002676]
MGVHAVGFAKPLGFTDAQLFSTVHGSAEDPVWSQDEALLFRLADELYATNGVCDELFAALSLSFIQFAGVSCPPCGGRDG